MFFSLYLNFPLHGVSSFPGKFHGILLRRSKIMKTTPQRVRDAGPNYKEGVTLKSPVIIIGIFFIFSILLKRAKKLIYGLFVIRWKIYRSY